VKILRSFPPLDAARIKTLAVSLVPKIPDSLYDEMVRHAK
jgi:cell cycle arrest protein BUB2